jgi:hypothetical protein
VSSIHARFTTVYFSEKTSVPYLFVEFIGELSASLTYPQNDYGEVEKPLAPLYCRFYIIPANLNL